MARKNLINVMPAPGMSGEYLITTNFGCIDYNVAEGCGTIPSNVYFITNEDTRVRDDGSWGSPKYPVGMGTFWRAATLAGYKVVFRNRDGRFWNGREQARQYPELYTNVV